MGKWDPLFGEKSKLIQKIYGHFEGFPVTNNAVFGLVIKWPLFDEFRIAFLKIKKMHILDSEILAPTSACSFSSKITRNVQLNVPLKVVVWYFEFFSIPKIICQFILITKFLIHLNFYRRTVFPLYFFLLGDYSLDFWTNQLRNSLNRLGESPRLRCVFVRSIHGTKTVPWQLVGVKASTPVN